jgi:hypothetical protein
VPQTTETPLSENDHDGIWLDDDLRGPIAAIFSLVSDQLGKVYPPDLSALEPAGKLSSKSADAMRVAADEIAHVVGAPMFNILQTNLQPSMVHSENGEPLLLVVGTDFLRKTPPREQRFLLARALESLRIGQHLFHHVREEELAIFLEAVVLTVSPDYEPAASFDQVESTAKVLRAALTRKVKKQLEDPVRMLLDERQALDPERIVRAAERACLKAGISLSNDLEAVVRVLAREGRAPLPAALKSHDELQTAYARVPLVRVALGYWASKEYWMLRHKLGFGFS